MDRNVQLPKDVAVVVVLVVVVDVSPVVADVVVVVLVVDSVAVDVVADMVDSLTSDGLVDKVPPLILSFKVLNELKVVSLLVRPVVLGLTVLKDVAELKFLVFLIRLLVEWSILVRVLLLTCLNSTRKINIVRIRVLILKTSTATVLESMTVAKCTAVTTERTCIAVDKNKVTNKDRISIIRKNLSKNRNRNKKALRKNQKNIVSVTSIADPRMMRLLRLT